MFLLCFCARLVRCAGIVDVSSRIYLHHNRQNFSLFSPLFNTIGARARGESIPFTWYVKDFRKPEQRPLCARKGRGTFIDSRKSSIV